MKYLQCRAIFLLLAGVFASTVAHGVEFSLYGETSLTNRSHDYEKPSFNVGSLDLYTSQQVSNKTNALVELLFEDHGEGFQLDVERMVVEHRVSESFTLGAGRAHTPLGFWNYNYHHGVLVQDTVTRPFFLQFEGQHEGIFPTHMVGLYGIKDFFPDNAIVRIQAGIGNGPSIDTRPTYKHSTDLETSNITDYNELKMAVGRISYTNIRKRFQIGVFGLWNDVVESGDDDATFNLSLMPKGDRLFDQSVAGLDFRLSAKSYYLMGEFFYMRSVDRIVSETIAPVLAVHNSYAYYFQAGFRFGDSFTLLARYEANQFEAQDSYYILREIEQEQHYVAGFRYDLDASSALRFEVNHAAPVEDEAHTTVTLQWFFLLL